MMIRNKSISLGTVCDWTHLIGTYFVKKMIIKLRIQVNDKIIIIDLKMDKKNNLCLVITQHFRLVCSCFCSYSMAVFRIR